MDKDALQCLPNCSGHGTFDLDTQTCTCEDRWSGDDCSKGLLHTSKHPQRNLIRLSFFNLQNCAIWIVDNTDTAFRIPASAILDGRESIAIWSSATADATNTASARMALVCVSPGGTENIAQWRDVRIVVQPMDNVASTATECGNADVIMVGMVRTAAFCWSRVAAMARTTIKVRFRL